MDEVFSDDGHVDPVLGCPCCTETRVDVLNWFDPGTGPFPRYVHEYVWCETCGTAYDPNHAGQVRQYEAEYLMVTRLLDRSDTGFAGACGMIGARSGCIFALARLAWVPNRSDKRMIQMILHICGNLAAGKTTTVEHLQPRLRWPCVPVGRIRNMTQDECATWEIVRRLWAVWDSADRTPGRSGIWLSTGFNAREKDLLETSAPSHLYRVWLTASPAILRARLQARADRSGGYWPYPETFHSLQASLLHYDAGTRRLPWMPNLIGDTGIMSPEVITEAIMERMLR